jgi:DNA-binding PadR family transcriptional regulator
MSDHIDQMRKGTTVVAILKLLVDIGEPMHGYEMIQRLEERSKGHFSFKEGLIYPTLHRMEKKDLLKSQWLGQAGSRRRKVYTVTDKGRRQLQVELGQWDRFLHGMTLLLGQDKSLP